MRVLLVHNRYQRRGGEDIVFESERALLERKGHDVSVYERHSDEIVGYAPWEKVDLAYRAVWAKDSAAAVRKILARHRPQVAFFHNTFPLVSPAAYYECASAGVPVVQTLPNYRLICPGGQLRRSGQICELCVGKSVPWLGVLHGCYRCSRAETAAVAAMLVFHRIAKTWERRVNTYIALTEYSRRKFIEGGLPAEKIVVKPNFLYPDPGPRVDESGHALFVGRLSAEKGISTLLRAWKLLPETPLKIAGDGPLLPLVEAAAGGEGGEGIECLGWLPREEILELLRGARFLVVPSEWYEGFPLTIVEALACGVPVIGSRIGGVGEIIDSGQSGLLFEPGNERDLAAKVKRLWCDKTLRTRLAANARSQFEDHYTADKNYEILMEIFENTIR